MSWRTKGQSVLLSMFVCVCFGSTQIKMPRKRDSHRGKTKLDYLIGDARFMNLASRDSSIILTLFFFFW